MGDRDGDGPRPMFAPSLQIVVDVSTTRPNAPEEKDPCTLYVIIVKIDGQTWTINRRCPTPSKHTHARPNAPSTPPDRGNHCC